MSSSSSSEEGISVLQYFSLNFAVLQWTDISNCIATTKTESHPYSNLTWALWLVWAIMPFLSLDSEVDLYLYNSD